MPWTVQKEKEQYYTEHARYAVEIYSEMTVKECMCVCVCVCVCVCSGPQLCPTLCDTMDCSPPGFSVHGIFQVRILEWVAIS